jgi:hypothetical protein
MYNGLLILAYGLIWQEPLDTTPPGRVNGYLVVAYGLLWGIFTLYAWVIHRRQQRLEMEVEELRRVLDQR